MFIHYLFERERERAGVGQRETGRYKIQSRLQALGCKQRAQYGFQTHVTGLNQLSHPGAPGNCVLDLSVQQDQSGSLGPPSSLLLAFHRPHLVPIQDKWLQLRQHDPSIKGTVSCPEQTECLCLVAVLYHALLLPAVVFVNKTNCLAQKLLLLKLCDQRNNKES